MDIETISNMNQEAGGHYFDKETMEFFNQRLSDFVAYKTRGRTFVIGQSRGWRVNPNAPISKPWSVAEFIPETGMMKSVILSPDIKHGDDLDRSDIIDELEKILAKEVA